jgi:hypothetical protein
MPVEVELVEGSPVVVPLESPVVDDEPPSLELPPARSTVSSPHPIVAVPMTAPIPWRARRRDSEPVPRCRFFLPTDDEHNPV